MPEQNKKILEFAFPLLLIVAIVGIAGYSLLHVSYVPPTPEQQTQALEETAPTNIYPRSIQYDSGSETTRVKSDSADWNAYDASLPPVQRGDSSCMPNSCHPRCKWTYFYQFSDAKCTQLIFKTVWGPQTNSPFNGGFKEGICEFIGESYYSWDAPVYDCTPPSQAYVPIESGNTGTDASPPPSAPSIPVLTVLNPRADVSYCLGADMHIQWKVDPYFDGIVSVSTNGQTIGRFTNQNESGIKNGLGEGVWNIPVNFKPGPYELYISALYHNPKGYDQSIGAYSKPFRIENCKG